MSKVAPAGPVYQAGRCPGNPLAVAAGLADAAAPEAAPEVYDRLEQPRRRLCASAPAGVTVNRVGSMSRSFSPPNP